MHKPHGAREPCGTMRHINTLVMHAHSHLVIVYFCTPLVVVVMLLLFSLTLLPLFWLWNCALVRLKADSTRNFCHFGLASLVFPSWPRCLRLWLCSGCGCVACWWWCYVVVTLTQRRHSCLLALSLKRAERRLCCSSSCCCWFSCCCPSASAFCARWKCKFSAKKQQR